MRIIAMIAMLMAGMFASNAMAENAWEKPALTDCSTEGDTQRQKDCERANYCVNSSTEACLAHVGDTTETQSRSVLLRLCFQREHRQCMYATNYYSGRSTNLTLNPDPWNCIYNTGEKARPSDCRRVNFCLDSAATTCSENIGAEKYTNEGKQRLGACIKEKEVSCMRAVD